MDYGETENDDCDFEQERDYDADDPHDELMKDDRDCIEPASYKKDKNIQFKKLQTTPSGTRWGPKSDPNICCWWCCHTFTTTPVSLPTNYDWKKERWTLHGIFCSVACAKAWSMIHIRGGDMGLKSALLTKFAKTILKLQPPFIPAPPQQCLKIFGGPMTIAQFRASSQSCICTLLAPPYDPQIQIFSQKNVLKKNSKQPKASPPASTSTLDLKLKRKNPKSKKGTLMETMNVQIKNSDQGVR